MTDETLVLRAIAPVEANSGGNGGTYEPWPIPDEDPEAAPKVMPLSEALDKPVEGVVLGKSSYDEDTGTYALPAVKHLTGEPSTSVDLHRTAARVQWAIAPLGVAVWYGEHTKEFWVMDARGLHSFDSVTAMYLGMGWQAL
jgi:hypothetical protein